MRAADSDLTAAARIRGAAMRLFAERGVAAISIRDVAAEAGVSSSLVVHHFKTKAGLKVAADARSVALLAEMLSTFPTDRTEVEPAMRSISEGLRDEPDLMAYLRRMLIDGGDAAKDLFTGLVDATAAELSVQERAGVVSRSADPRTRAAFLLVNDLALIVLRDLVTHAIGLDPLSEKGLERWSSAVMAVYTQGFFASGSQTQQEES
jgi:TetR/AcrR family transcriptional regulator, regulator of cefoperazone and chloramphenicol sensitivity